jgi:hypothetical protein
MALNPRPILAHDVLFNYTDHSVVVMGARFQVDEVPSHILSDFSNEEELEWMFMLCNFELKKEKEKEERIARQLLFLEDPERIIGFALTMSRILHQKESALKTKET